MKFLKQVIISLVRAIVRIWNIFLGLIAFFLSNISLKLGKNILLLYPIFTILTSFLTFAIKKLILALMQYPSNYIYIKEQGFSFFLVKKSYQNIVFYGIFFITTFTTQKCDSILEPCPMEISNYHNLKDFGIFSYITIKKLYHSMIIYLLLWKEII